MKRVDDTLNEYELGLIFTIFDKDNSKTISKDEFLYVILYTYFSLYFYIKNLIYI